MTEYNRESFDHRTSLTSLRTSATKQIIALSLALIAVPASLAALVTQTDLEASISGAYWTLNFIGIFAAVVSVLAGGLFLLSAPNWAKDKTRESLLDCTYVIAPIGMIASAIFLGLGALIAIIGKLCH